MAEEIIEELVTGWPYRESEAFRLVREHATLVKRMKVQGFPARDIAQAIVDREFPDPDDEALGQTLDPRILVSYDIVTPESAEEGDVAERGWIDDEGASMEPDEYDIEVGRTVVDKAIKFLCYDGATEPSSDPFSSGTWYTTEGDQDYRTGATEYRAYHLKDFTREEERAVYNGVVTQRCGRRR
jgi:hypothetical protein